MNIFLILIMSLFMAGYYMFFAPNNRIYEHETEYAISKSDLRSVADCVMAVHNAKIMGSDFVDVCVEQNMIKSDYICLDSRMSLIDCGRYKKPIHSFIVTTSGVLDPSDYNEMMEILEKNFATSGTFGIYQDGMIFSGGTSTKRIVPQSIQKSFELQDGQLVYMTQYDIPDANVDFATLEPDDVVCPAGATKTYRFGRWQCTGYNIKTGCGGDTIWDSDLMKCVPDETRKPLCTGQQTAVMVEDLWQCVEPFGERECPSGLLAKLNYNTLEWECVDDPEMVTKSVKKKCDLASLRVVRGTSGDVARVYPNNTCTDCEKMIVDEESCSTICVPDVDKIKSKSCYPGNPSDCSGNQKAFYFGFPDLNYVANVSAVKGVSVPFDELHSRNRKFNCLYCPKGTIVTKDSLYPYVADCSNSNASEFIKEEQKAEDTNGGEKQEWTMTQKASETNDLNMKAD